MLHSLLRPLALVTAVSVTLGLSWAGNEHWSRQFPIPKRLIKMDADTSMSKGHSKPNIKRIKWHDGRLWMAGAWESGLRAETGKQKPNQYWYLWTWSPVEGYLPISYFLGSKGGAGPDGKILDFEFLPDGKIVVAGSFKRLDNPGGNMYHRVNALAVYDPKEPTANKWQPLGDFQYNGTVSEGGSIEAIAYDPQSNDLFIGGTFAGLRGGKELPSRIIHRYDFDTQSYEPMKPGLLPKGAVYRIKVDTSTKPSTVYVAGSFRWTGGDGLPPTAGGTAKYSTGFAKWQDGAGWTTYPEKQEGLHSSDQILSKAGDFMYFAGARINDFLVDGEDIYIGGAFKGGTSEADSFKGIAKWDASKQRWVDPTGKGGVGRDIFNIEKAANGKIYFAGAFGGFIKGNQFYKGFADGTPAALILSYDPKTQTWDNLAGGLASFSMPEVRLAVDGNNVWLAGDFAHFDVASAEIKKTAEKAKYESSMIARWNETIDFLKDPAGAKAFPPKPAPLPSSPPEVSASKGNEHWSRSFPRPPRPKNPKTPPHTAQTGMYDGQGTPDISGIGWHKDTLYFCGSWEVTAGDRWYVWSYHPQNGWTALSKKGLGPESPPEGMKWHDGKLYVYGAIRKYSGIGTYDPQTNTWAQFGGTFQGKPVEGNAVAQRGGPINDIAWDSKTGDMYMVGSTGLTGKDPAFPKSVGQVIRVDKAGEYHPMGYALLPENPGKPVFGIYAIHVDETKTPSDIYIGGTFNYYGKPPSSNSRMLYNVAKWDHAAQDWGPVGKGNPKYYSEHDRKYYPEGLPGLAAHPGDEFSGFLYSFFPRVQSLTMDKEGNLYAGGSLAVIDDSFPVKQRAESFGIAKFDPKTQKWGQVAPGFKGFSRDVLEMHWVNDETMLVTGGMDYSWDWTPINGVALLNVKTGKLTPLGGGLVKAHRGQLIAPLVHADIHSDGSFWFGGFFQRAGVNDNSNLDGGVVSQYVAHYDPNQALDPNQGLAVKLPDAPCAITGFSSKSAKLAFEATTMPEGASLTWYEKRANGDFAKKGQGKKFTANARLKKGMKSVTYYVAVTNQAGTEGAKRPLVVTLKDCP